MKIKILKRKIGNKVIPYSENQIIDVTELEGLRLIQKGFAEQYVETEIKIETNEKIRKKNKRSHEAL